MCIAILKTKNGTITDEQLKNCYRRNKDGAGIAYTVNNKLIIEKGIFNMDEFVAAVRAAEQICDNNMLIHCRITTSGNIDTLNCHPHVLNANMCMIHNGVLHIDVPKNSLVSDTIIYCNKYLKQFRNKDLLHNRALTEYIAENIGDNNKFVFLNNKGEYNIINEEVGHWKDGVWYSNNSYEGYATIYGNGYYDWDDDDELDYYYRGYCGYNYTGKYHWDKDDKKDIKLIPAKKEPDLVELENATGQKIVVEEEGYIKYRVELATEIANISDSDLDYYGEFPLVDIYDGGILCSDSYVDTTGMVYLVDIFPELYKLYEEKYNSYLMRARCGLVV